LAMSCSDRDCLQLDGEQLRPLLDNARRRITAALH